VDSGRGEKSTDDVIDFFASFALRNVKDLLGVGTGGSPFESGKRDLDGPGDLLLFLNMTKV
jgi:hypothetical protein